MKIFIDVNTIQIKIMLDMNSIMKHNVITFYQD